MSNAISVNESQTGQIVVVGAGAWGTTLANLIASTGRTSILVAHTEAHAARLVATRENERYLPAVTINERVTITHELEGAVADASVVVIAVPSQQMRTVASEIAGSLRSDALIVSCVKGLELGTLLRMTEVIAVASSLDPERVCALSGPNLARVRTLMRHGSPRRRCRRRRSASTRAAT